MVFNTGVDAEQALDEIMEDGLRFWRDQIETPTTQRACIKPRALRTCILARLQKWTEAYAILRSAKSFETDDMTAKMNRLYHRTTWVFVKRALVTETTASDHSLATFESVVKAAMNIVNEYEQNEAQLPVSSTSLNAHHSQLAKEEVLQIWKSIAMDCDGKVWMAWRVVRIAQRAAVMEEQKLRQCKP